MNETFNYLELTYLPIFNYWGKPINCFTSEMSQCVRAVVCVCPGDMLSPDIKYFPKFVLRSKAGTSVKIILWPIRKQNVMKMGCVQCKNNLYKYDKRFFLLCVTWL